MCILTANKFGLVTENDREVTGLDALNIRSGCYRINTEIYNTYVLLIAYYTCSLAGNFEIFEVVCHQNISRIKLKDLLD